MRVMDRLGALQSDPLEIAGNNHDLGLLARIAGYRRAWTDGLHYRDRVLYETHNKMFSIVPTAELPYYRITWDRQRESRGAAAFDEHAPLVEELLDRIRRDGLLSSTALDPRAAIDWYWRATRRTRSPRPQGRRPPTLTDRPLIPIIPLGISPSPRSQRRRRSRTTAVPPAGARAPRPRSDHDLDSRSGPGRARQVRVP